MAAPDRAIAVGGRVIVQRRDGKLRLFRQHDDGLLSGELALAWREAEDEPAVSDVLVLATSLHDLSWRRLDAEPRWNADTGRPHDFLDFSRDTKGPLSLQLTLREVEGKRFDGAEQLREAWRGGARRRWRLRLVPGGK